MSQIKRNILTAILLISIGTYCNSQSRIIKKTRDFKQVLHSIDTLAILTPFVDIKTIDEKNNFQNDTVLSQNLSHNFSLLIADLLKNKYSLQNILGNSVMNSNIIKDFNELDNKINKSDKFLMNIDFPDSIFQTGNNSSRYCLTSIINGYYPTKERVRQDTRKALPTTLAVAVLTLGHVYLIPESPSIITLRIMLYDRFHKRVLYYKSTNLSSAAYIPKASYSELNQIVMANYKTLYYK